MNPSLDLDIAYGLYRYENPVPKRVDFILVRDLTKEEFDRAGEAISLVYEILRGFDAYLDAAVHELREAMDAARILLLDTSKAKDTTSWAPSLEYRAVCVSIAVRMYEEHVFSHVHRRWGKNSHQHDDVSALFHNLYDQSLEYRIFYYLRNALVHSSRRLFIIHMSANLVGPPEDESTQVALELRLSKDAFAMTDVKAAVRTEVSELAADPDLVEMSQIAAAHVKSLNEQLTPWLHPGRNEAVRTIWSFMLETLQDGQGGPHFHKHRIGSPMAGLSQLAMTDAVFNYVLTVGASLGLRHGREA